MNPRIASDPGIFLREYTPDDAPRIAEAVRESASSMAPWLGWARADYSLEDARAWLASTAEQQAAGLLYTFGVFDHAEAHCGTISLNKIDAVHRQANIGYWIRASRQGEGIAGEAVRAIACIGFELLRLIRLEIVAAEDNRASRRVAEKAGALFEALLRNRLLLPSGPANAALYSLIPET